MAHHDRPRTDSAGVLARTSPPDAVVALRYAQMVTLTPMQVTHSEAIVPIITAGLPPISRRLASRSSHCRWTPAKRSTTASPVALT